MEIERFLQSRDYSARTSENYRRLLGDLEQWLGGRQPTTELLQEWIDNHRWGGHQRRQAVYVMRAYFGWEIGLQSPAHKLTKPRVRLTPQRTITEADAMKLLTSLDTMTVKGKRDVAIICLLLDQGLRASEIVRLRLEDLRVEERTFVVLQKGRRWRQGAFSELTQVALGSWLAVRPMVALRSCQTVFCSLSGHGAGGPLTRAGLWKMLVQEGKRCGIGPVHPHMFRRGMATMMARSGAPLPIIAVSGGWESHAQVRVYTQALRPRDGDPWFPTNSLMK